MKRVFAFALPLLAFSVAQAGGCAPASSPAAPNAAASAQPAMPPELQEIAKKVLGPNVRALLDGDLAHNGYQQVLLLDPVSPPPGDVASGVALWRAAVLQQSDTGWKEMLLCDEYLKNSSGYLRGTPLVPVSGWRLDVGSTDGKNGRELSFTPLPMPGVTGMPTVKVRWNPAVNRYQSFDIASKGFLEELPLLQIPTLELR